MLIWAVCTLLCFYGVFTFLAPKHYPWDLFLAVGSFVGITLNEVVYSARKDQLEIERDVAIKNAKEQSQMVLAICPVCKNRIPSDLKICLE